VQCGAGTPVSVYDQGEASRELRAVSITLQVYPDWGKDHRSCRRWDRSCSAQPIAVSFSRLGEGSNAQSQPSPVSPPRRSVVSSW
jgi:hypothetical protein